MVFEIQKMLARNRLKAFRFDLCFIARTNFIFSIFEKKCLMNINGILLIIFFVILTENTSIRYTFEIGTVGQLTHLSINERCNIITYSLIGLSISRNKLI